MKLLKKESAEPRWEVRTDTQQEEEYAQMRLGPPSVLEVRPCLDDVVQ